MGYEHVKPLARVVRKAPTTERAPVGLQLSASASTNGRMPYSAAPRNVGPIVSDVLRMRGQPLDSPTRADVESTLGHDFSKVRVHTDAAAAHSARVLGASAYTVGSHVVFGQGRYAPDTTRGSELLVHELVHTIQQGMIETPPVDRLALTRIDDVSEREARGLKVDTAAISGRGGPVAVALSPAEEQSQTHGSTASPLPAAKTLKIEFHAFIPGGLGRPFSSFPHAQNLTNQTAFNALVAAVTTPNSWKPQPRKTESDVVDPGSARNVWFYSTDERSFGGGSHRVGFKGAVNVADIGSLKTKGTVFSHACDASHRVRSTDTGWFTSSNETGSVDGPFAKTAPVKGVSETISDSAASSTIETEGQAAYAFMPTVSPDIDYNVRIKIDRKPGGLAEVSTLIEHNLFPFYEILINGVSHWNFSSVDTGPTLTNLNSSATGSGAPQTF